MSKKRHGHHGGAWKVAYADFVTAMMALFLVLWLTSQDEKIKEAVERSFKNPFISLTKDSTGLIPSKDAAAVKDQSKNFDSASAVELNMLRKLSQDIMKTLQKNEENDNEDLSQIKMEMTAEGLRVSVYDVPNRPIFEPRSASFTQYGKWIFTSLAWQVARYTNNFQIELEGHIESGAPPVRDDYGKWEITADRANMARRILQQNGVASFQIKKVAGFGDTKPMPNQDVADERNSRVALLLRVKNHNNND